jgi:hypothetical protein
MHVQLLTTGVEVLGYLILAKKPYGNLVFCFFYCKILYFITATEYNETQVNFRHKYAYFDPKYR